MPAPTLSAAFASGMYVFPVAPSTRPTGRPTSAAATASPTMRPAGSSRSKARATYWIAAIRSFEEAGVLCQPDGQPVRFDEPALEERYLAHRAAAVPATWRLVELCALEGLRLATDDIHYVSHWITPIGERRRFDTRFFVARAAGAGAPARRPRDHRQPVGTAGRRWRRPSGVSWP